MILLQYLLTARDVNPWHISRTVLSGYSRLSFPMPSSILAQACRMVSPPVGHRQAVMYTSLPINRVVFYYLCPRKALIDAYISLGKLRVYNVIHVKHITNYVGCCLARSIGELTTTSNLTTESFLASPSLPDACFIQRNIGTARVTALCVIIVSPCGNI